MNLTRHTYTIRLNPREHDLLNQALDVITDAQREALIKCDRSGRSGYQNFSGRSPADRMLIIRRALQHGLTTVARELDIDIDASNTPIQQSLERLGQRIINDDKGAKDAK